MISKDSPKDARPTDQPEAPAAPPVVEYPKMLYHATAAPITVQNADEEAKATADGYEDTPVSPEAPRGKKGVTRVTRNGLQVITDALKLLGVVAGHEEPTSAEQADSFARLTELIDSWGTHAQTMHVSRRDVVPLSVGVQTYTIGDGGTFDLPRPMAIDAAAILSGTTEIGVEVLLDQQYVGQPVKPLTGALVTALAYFPTVPLGEVWVWPVPTVAQSLVVYYAEPLQQFPDLVTPLSLAPGYAKALRTNLAIELAPEFGRVVDPTVERLARESLADVKRQNVPLVEVGIDPALTGGGGGYDILTDG